MLRWKEDLALNNLQWLICLKTKPSHQSILIWKQNGLMSYWDICGEKKQKQRKVNSEKRIKKQYVAIGKNW